MAGAIDSCGIFRRLFRMFPSAALLLGLAGVCIWQSPGVARGETIRQGPTRPTPLSPTRTRRWCSNTSTAAVPTLPKMPSAASRTRERPLRDTCLCGPQDVPAGDVRGQARPAAGLQSCPVEGRPLAQLLPSFQRYDALRGRWEERFYRQVRLGIDCIWWASTSRALKPPARTSSAPTRKPATSSRPTYGPHICSSLSLGRPT